MDTPDSMKEELSRWNSGDGIDLEGWISCMGNYSLAVGYLTLFWPEFVEYDGYILHKGFSIDSLRGFENEDKSNRISVEWVMNHLHIADIHYGEDRELSKDKVIILGNALKEIYQSKLDRQFPDLPCHVEFYIPENEEDLMQYQISFWQKKHENSA